MTDLPIDALLASRSELRRHEKWDRPQLQDYQALALRRLRQHAYANSPFYRRFHAGLTDAPLEELPVLTKAELMRSWDEVVADRAARLADVRDFLARPKPGKSGERFRDRYYAVSTAGSTGLRGVFIYDTPEWMTVLASYLRAGDWSGVTPAPGTSLKAAFVSTTRPWHQSTLVAATLGRRFPSMISIDSVEPVKEIVAKLNDYQPRFLIAYANMARLLAGEQIAGNLRIGPEAVFCTSEVLTGDSRRMATKAWGIDPFNVYAATETGAIASECSQHGDLHVYEDLVIIEPVGPNGMPVPPGDYGAKLLATVLFSRTVPLIRYEISDSVCLSPDPCTCHCPFISIAGVQGRMEDAVHMFGRSGHLVRVQPNVFHDVMEHVPVDGWQIVQEPDNHLRVLVKGPGDDFDEASLIERFREELEKLGVEGPAIEIERVSSVSKGGLGKTYLIRALRD